MTWVCDCWFSNFFLSKRNIEARHTRTRGLGKHNQITSKWKFLDWLFVSSPLSCKGVKYLFRKPSLTSSISLEEHGSILKVFFYPILPHFLSCYFWKPHFLFRLPTLDYLINIGYGITILGGNLPLE